MSSIIFCLVVLAFSGLIACGGGGCTVQLYNKAGHGNKKGVFDVYAAFSQCGCEKTDTCFYLRVYVKGCPDVNEEVQIIGDLTAINAPGVQKIACWQMHDAFVGKEVIFKLTYKINGEQKCSEIVMKPDCEKSHSRHHKSPKNSCYKKSDCKKSGECKKKSKICSKKSRAAKFSASDCSSKSGVASGFATSVAGKAVLFFVILQAVLLF